MKIGIMQPYFLPYIGYFQILQSADIFVIFDDVNYIKRGWINRNHILVNGKSYLFTVKLVKASQNKFINELYLKDQIKSNERILNNLKHSYSKAPQYRNILPLVEEIFSNKEDKLSLFIIFSLKKICQYLEIKKKCIQSSKINKNNFLKGEEKIIDLCKRLGCTEYINPIGGVRLYNRDKFKRNGIDLRFLTSKELKYPQFGNSFIPNLSIIDVLMFNPKEKVRSLLKEYVLV